MGKALYRKYRSKNLSEIVGQEHITSTLSNALKAGNISHAYLFTGPRGVGKTSIARILAHEVNGLPYEDDANHLDIIEIDAASNRRIDEIRELRERVHAAPTSAKYKVYIIDEVHMLTKEAFNALLKTLEEPPAHVIFILATTEAHKLPETIVSRTQRFSFKPIEEEKVVDHLAAIARQENITITPEALRLLAQHGGGSFRDSISLLDQAGNISTAIELADVQRTLGIAPEQILNELLESLSKGSPAAIISLILKLQEQGYQASQIAKQLSEKLRTGLLEGHGLYLEPRHTTELLKHLLEVPASHDSEAALELALLDAALRETGLQTLEKTASSEPREQQPPKPPNQRPRVSKPKSAPAKVVNEPLAATTADLPPKQARASTNSSLDTETWQAVLGAIKQQHNTLYSVARMAEPKFEQNILTLRFSFAFHQKRINEARNKQLISDIFRQQTGSRVEIVCVVGDAQNHKKSDGAKTAAPLETINNIFGGAEVIES
jgi:DNA polymerase-3 subunit gamma/tau